MRSVRGVLAQDAILDHVRTIDAFLDMAGQMEATFDALVDNLKR